MPVQFDNPPVNEVVFSVVFDGDVVDEVRALSDFRPRVRDEFPDLEKKPPAPRIDEQFGATAIEPSSELILRPIAPSGRYWFIGKDPTRVIQLQPDRLSFNWRVVTNDPYPGFDVLFPEFESVYSSLAGVVEQTPEVAWCELTYINPIPIETADDGSHGQLARVLNFLGPAPKREVLPAVEDTALQQRFRLSREPGADPVGRLFVTAQPAIMREDEQPAYIVTLLARIRPEGSKWDELESTFRWAHELIVNGFKEVTTEVMHAKWGERDDK